VNVRHEKIAAQIRRIVGTVLQRDMADPRVAGLISVTHVDLTPNMREARIYVSVLSDLPESTVMQGLVSSQKHVQQRVAESLAIKFAPRLSFHIDHALKRQNEVLTMLNQVAQSEVKESESKPAAEEHSPNSARQKRGKAKNVNEAKEVI